MSSWGWRPQRTMGIWRHGAGWMRPFVAAAPWLTLILLLIMLHFTSGTLTSAKGVLFDLPAPGLSEGEATDLVALAMMRSHETIVFFDDARYMLDDPASVRTFGDHLAQRISQRGQNTLLVLADRRVPGGTLMDLAAVARRSGARRVLFAEKHGDKQQK